jgi:hypothetical protein
MEARLLAPERAVQALQSQYRFSRCMVDTKCLQYSPDKGPGRALAGPCRCCGQCAALHITHPVGDDPSMHLFSAIRNLRCLVSIIIEMMCVESGLRSNRNARDFAAACTGLSNQVKIALSHFLGQCPEPEASRCSAACNVRSAAASV